MEPIVVPAVPKSSFNKNRRISDLVKKQIDHFHHVALKSGMQIDSALERDIATEAGAARYIARVTREIRAQSKPSVITMPAPRAVTPAPPSNVIEQIAASSEPPSARPSKTARKKPKKGRKKRS